LPLPAASASAAFQSYLAPTSRCAASPLPPAGKRLFPQRLFLCLSRACLGKTISLGLDSITSHRKKTVRFFLPPSTASVALLLLLLLLHRHRPRPPRRSLPRTAGSSATSVARPRAPRQPMSGQQRDSSRRNPSSRTAARTHARNSNDVHSTAQHSTAQHSTAQHSTAQHSTAQHSTAQHSTAQHSARLDVSQPTAV
jgi:hypothetical protein